MAWVNLLCMRMGVGALQTRKAVESDHVRLFGIGEEVRDWSSVDGDDVIYPYDAAVVTINESSIPEVIRFQIPCDSIDQRVWRLSAARDAMKQLYQSLDVPD